ncbi:mas-related G-protein coupled receptor member D-like [Ammospiza nelsoni]|uniref:mas-related G-protein coupled receptor member D-like n=1 Tax=Ammospiza caudacuta TaxID=2857398 RepID=UPI002739DD8D|nr:mas-related G-protein coupled receptor member D-like [Ammospiza caudacuta]XP_059331390.1 mas-related G-protein coupled receptor member D-like [Ammospiza nelsoni]
MEVTTVSPSPASPTEGADLCKTDVTSVAIHSVTLLICLCGLAGNGAVLWVLSLIRRNPGIFKMAVADFTFLLVTVLSALLFLVEEVSCSPIVPLRYLNFLFQLSVASYYWALFRLMPSNSVMTMHKVCWLRCPRDLPLRLRWLVDSVQYWAFFALFTVIPTVTLLCPSKEQELCQATLISMYTLILLLFIAPVVISSTVDFIRAKWGSQQQQPKRRDIVFILIVLLTLLLSIWNFLQLLSYITVSPQIFFLLTCIHISIKPFIYFLVGSWRTDSSMAISWKLCTVGVFMESLQRVFD